MADHQKEKKKLYGQVTKALQHDNFFLTQFKMPPWYSETKLRELEKVRSDIYGGSKRKMREETKLKSSQTSIKKL